MPHRVSGRAAGDDGFSGPTCPSGAFFNPALRLAGAISNMAVKATSRPAARKTATAKAAPAKKATPAEAKVAKPKAAKTKVAKTKAAKTQAAKAKAAVAARKADLQATLAFGQYDDFRVEHLSGGTRQKLNLALALLPDPEVLLLDEPYAGFDYETYLRFWEMSRELADRGRSILIVSHFVEDRERFDRIYRVADGRCERER